MSKNMSIHNGYLFREREKSELEDDAHFAWYQAKGTSGHNYKLKRIVDPAQDRAVLETYAEAKVENSVDTGDLYFRDKNQLVIIFSQRTFNKIMNDKDFFKRGHVLRPYLSILESTFLRVAEVGRLPKWVSKEQRQDAIPLSWLKPIHDKAVASSEEYRKPGYMNQHYYGTDIKIDKAEIVAVDRLVAATETLQEKTKQWLAAHPRTGSGQELVIS